MKYPGGKEIGYRFHPDLYHLLYTRMDPSHLGTFHLHLGNYLGMDRLNAIIHVIMRCWCPRWAALEANWCTDAPPASSTYPPGPSWLDTFASTLLKRAFNESPGTRTIALGG